MGKQWNVEGILEMAWSFRPACILTAGAELNVFTKLAGAALTAEQVSGEVGGDVRAVTILLDSLVTLELLGKEDGRYSTPADVAEVLSEGSPKNMLAAVWHLANCMRSWAQLSQITKSGEPADRKASIRGEDADRESFIQAMDNFSKPDADEVVGRLGDLPVTNVLDLGGASGTWTIALLRLFAGARATIFDLPEVIPMAKERIGAAGFSERVDFAGGDYLEDALPAGADFAWLSAIVHQHSREMGQRLYGKTFEALSPGGRIAIRDVVMNAARTEPVAGALFAVNMLVNTDGGNSYTFEEFEEDLTGAGFVDVTLVHQDAFMHSLVTARKPS